jgi:hypothetical protein
MQQWKHVTDTVSKGLHRLNAKRHSRASGGIVFLPPDFTSGNGNGLRPEIFQVQEKSFIFRKAIPE